MRNRSIRNYNNGGVVAPADKTRTVQDTVALNRKVSLSVRSYYDQGTVRDFDFNPKDIELAGKHDVDYLNYVYDKKYGKDLKRLLLSDKENAELDKLGYLQRKARVAGTQKYSNGGKVKKNNQFYDIDRALELGYIPDETGHMDSRDYLTGRILKTPAHPTWNEAIKKDKELGYRGFVDPKGNVYTISPNDLPREGYFSPNIENMKAKRKYFLGGLIKGIGSALGKAAPILEQAAPYAMSAINSINNVRQTGKLRTSRNPSLVKYAPSQYKSNLGEISDRNEAAYSSFIGNENPGAGALNKNLAFATMLDANSKAGLQDAEARNRFNMVQDRTNLAVAQQNAGITNATQEANLARYNDKIVSETQAYNAGFQDLINVDANRRAGNMQQKEMMLNFLGTAETGAMQRLADQFGMSIEDFIKMIGNSNRGFRFGRTNTSKRNKGISKYNSTMGETGD